MEKTEKTKIKYESKICLFNFHSLRSPMLKNKKFWATPENGREVSSLAGPELTMFLAADEAVFPWQTASPAVKSYAWGQEAREGS